MLSSSTVSAADEVLEGLSEVQREAASYLDGPLVIVAGPGSGKTRVMSHRMAYLIATGVQPWRALGVTFTNKAAGELAGRCESLVSRFAPGAERAHVSTFHSWGARFLRRHCDLAELRPEFSIYDRADQTQLMKRLLSDMESDLGVNGVLAEISRAKNDNTDADTYASLSTDRRHEMNAEVYSLYQSALVEANAVDFDDLLMLPFRILAGNDDVRDYWQERYLHLMVDEFQDTNSLQFDLVTLLGARHGNVCIVGDPDQSIYSWRNARPENMHAFRQRFKGARVFELNESYRSTKKIIAVADTLISHNNRNFERTLFTNNDAGADIRVVGANSPEQEAQLVVDRYEQLSGVSPSFDGAVLYRTNAQSRVIEDECIQRGIPYRLIGGLRFYDRREVKDALAMLKVVVNPTDEVSFRRIVNVPPRGIGAVTLRKLEYYALNQRVTLMDATLASTDPVLAQSMGIAGKTLGRVADFGRFVRLLMQNSERMEVAELLEFALKGSGYLQWLGKDPSTQLERRQNLDELITVARKFGTTSSQTDPSQALNEFLEHSALFANVDSLDDESEDALSLITLHQAKGLEFDTVFIVGVSEGLLPHQMAMEQSAMGLGDGEELMEERRLMYVGMTRARRELHLSYAMSSSRGFPGMRSRFLDEIEGPYVEEAGWRGSVRHIGNGSLRSSGRVVSGHAPRVDFDNSRAGLSDEESVSAALDYDAGDRVVHPTYGRGVVINSRKSGGDVVVNVAFMDSAAGVKQLMASMAKLERVAPGDNA